MNQKNNFTQDTNIPIFVINLKQDISKKEHMLMQSKKHALEFTFIDAVYGKELSPVEIDSVYDRERSLTQIKRDLFGGEIGCALSHKYIYQKMVDEEIAYAVVFEDDVDIDVSIHEVIDAIPNFPLDWEIMLLGYYRNFPKNKFYRISFRERKKISTNFKAVRFTDLMHSTMGYVINLNGARRLLGTLNEGISKPIDHYTGNDSDVNLYGIYPQCVRPHIVMQSHSGMLEDRLLYKKERAELPKTIKEKIKQKLDEMGWLPFFKEMNYWRVTWQNEFKSLAKRSKKPEKYTKRNQ